MLKFSRDVEIFKRFFFLRTKLCENRKSFWNVLFDVESSNLINYIADMLC